jgi:hypothetical protein
LVNFVVWLYQSGLNETYGVELQICWIPNKLYKIINVELLFFLQGDSNEILPETWRCWMLYSNFGLSQFVCAQANTSKFLVGFKSPPIITAALTPNFSLIYAFGAPYHMCLARSHFLARERHFKPIYRLYIIL